MSDFALSENPRMRARQLQLIAAGKIDASRAPRLRRIQGGKTLTKDFAGANVVELGARTIRVQASSAARDRAGDIVEQHGLFWVGPTVPVLWSHSPTEPIGRASLSLENGALHALIEFAPAGISPKADEICGLCKAGTITAVSIGFDPCTSEPVNPQQPRAGTRYLSAEILELSLCSVGANADATIIQRAGLARHRSMAAHRSAASHSPADPLEALRQNIVQARSRSSVHLCAAIRQFETARATLISDATYRPAASRQDVGAARDRAKSIYERLRLEEV